MSEEQLRQKATRFYCNWNNLDPGALSDKDQELIKMMDWFVKTEITSFLDFLLKQGYCDSDVYSEPPSVIDQFFTKKD